METNRKTFILLLFPLFPTFGHQEAFENLLKVARLVVSREFRRTLSPDARKRPLHLVHTWVKNAAGQDPDASVAIFLWVESGPLISAASSLGTLDDRVSEVRTARKVLVVPDELWDEVAVSCGAGVGDATFVARYPGMGIDKSPEPKPLLLLRQRLDYGLPDAAALGAYLGTRDRRRAPSSAYLPQVGHEREAVMHDTTGPPDETLRIRESSPPREDEITLEIATGLNPMPVARTRRSPSAAVIEVPRLVGSKRPDPRCDDEDLRDTIEPPPPSPLPEREDPTKPKR